ncbi:hypothetical protein [Lysobacter capsici]|uniref:hypothetical protein n=1 Tax=Lysobacter capsici TaxID=435897 RepID=UPI001C001A10|nr:hypothetical protein [Lysobacter capsici]QWF18679.1 hypothetical protein KME82_08040 [Lysobacter capsici]
MNTERLTTLAQWLEAGAKHEKITFDITRGILVKNIDEFDPSKPTECQTTCCIAGACVQFYGDMSDLVEEADDRTYRNGNTPVPAELTWRDVRDQAAQLLGLSDSTAMRLFSPELFFGGDLKDYNDPAWAARTIRHLIATGESDWTATRAQAVIA